jgi:hypothetical protein
MFPAHLYDNCNINIRNMAKVFHVISGKFNLRVAGICTSEIYARTWKLFVICAFCWSHCTDLLVIFEGKCGVTCSSDNFPFCFPSPRINLFSNSASVTVWILTYSYLKWEKQKSGEDVSRRIELCFLSSFQLERGKPRQRRCSVWVQSLLLWELARFPSLIGWSWD